MPSASSVQPTRGCRERKWRLGARGGRGAYGSSGGLYAVQAYLSVRGRRVRGLDADAYYYDPFDHALVQIPEATPLEEAAYDRLVNRPVFHRSAFGIFLVADLAAIQPMYADRSLHYATLEAGLMTQVLEETGPICGIGLCQIGELDTDLIHRCVNLNPTHVVVHSLLGGVIDD